MICDFGDVVVVPFPFVDVVAERRRPCLILSRASFNETHHHSICAMITTAARSRWPSDTVIQDLKQAGLDRSCVIRWKVFTLPNDFILRIAGKLAVGEQNNIRSIARDVLL